MTLSSESESNRVLFMLTHHTIFYVQLIPNAFKIELHIILFQQKPSSITNCIDTSLTKWHFINFKLY